MNSVWGATRASQACRRRPSALVQAHANTNTTTLNMCTTTTTADADDTDVNESAVVAADTTALAADAVSVADMDEVLL